MNKEKTITMTSKQKKKKSAKKKDYRYATFMGLIEVKK